MGMIGEALVSQVNKFAKTASLVDYAGNLQNIGVDPNSIKDVKQLIDDGLDPLHAAYVAMQHLVSLFAESVSVLPELKAYCDIAGPAEEEYIPKGPPLSPLTGSYFTCWAFFDLQFGPDKETIGTCLLDVTEYLDYSADTNRILNLTTDFTDYAETDKREKKNRCNQCNPRFKITNSYTFKIRAGKK